MMKQLLLCLAVAAGPLAAADPEPFLYKAMFVREEEWDKRPLHGFDQAIAAFHE